jgi:hypothetical protein
MYRNLLIYILEPLQGLSYEKLAEVGKKLQEGDEENRAVGEVLFHALQTIKTRKEQGEGGTLLGVGALFRGGQRAKHKLIINIKLEDCQHAN